MKHFTMKTAMYNKRDLPPKVFYCVKAGNFSLVILPASVIVFLKIPQCPRTVKGVPNQELICQGVIRRRFLHILKKIKNDK